MIYLIDNGISLVVAKIIFVLYRKQYFFSVFFFVSVQSAMYRNGNIVLIVNDDVWQLCISGSGTTSAHSEAPDDFTLSQPEVLPESSELFLINVHLNPSLIPPNHVHLHEHCSGDKFTLVMKPIECVYDAVQCSWSGTVFQWSRHESIKPPLCGSETNTCTGRLSCSVYTDSVCVSQGRQCQCRSCVQCY